MGCMASSSNCILPKDTLPYVFPKVSDTTPFPTRFEEDIRRRHEAYYTEWGEIEKVIRSGGVSLIKGSWLLQFQGKVLPRRQDLPPKAAWSPEEFLKIDTTSRMILAISYCWFTAEHPDPNGIQFKRIASFIRRWFEAVAPHHMGEGAKFRCAADISQLGVFFDWCSLPQVERSEQDNIIFKEALRDINIWYASQLTYKWLLTTVAPGVEKCENRGWPCFERSISSLITRSDYVLDLGKFDDAESLPEWSLIETSASTARRPPIHPDKFRCAVEGKCFTNGADREFVADRYERTYFEVMASTSSLNFHGLGWGDEDMNTIVQCLPDCPHLTELYLGDNEISDAAVLMLALQLPRTRIQKLMLFDNPCGDGGARALAHVLPHCPSLVELGYMTRTSHVGKKVLISAWRGKSMLLKGLRVF